MKGRGLVIISLLCCVSLAGCSINNEKNSNNDLIRKEHKETSIKKNKTTDLPIVIYKNSNYDKMSDSEDVFEKKLVNVSVENFDESKEIKLIDQFKNRSFVKEIDFINSDFVTLSLNKSFSSTRNEKKAYESFNLIDGTDFVIGTDVIGNVEPLIAEQISFLTTDWQLGKNAEETGEIYFAIPKKYIETKMLQLKVVTDIDSKKEFLYVDIN